ncbi:hypothetical protein A7A08_01694 [Methyloligella halotolerans]|uniref:Helix-turn-helix domain-containing protein n=1 Tax=Methyloligella halotolerans TaxID=1177755 RepID=A0A1E2S027_9HYPH|nr:helix-turn-helix domain-containing protein [Methyloligella halotolerans]ODA67659.1 hypothetical protein A7A08_01694 [Methyloligella halotolerans]
MNDIGVSMAEAARDLYRPASPAMRARPAAAPADEGGINKAQAYYAVCTHPGLSAAAKAVGAVLIDHHNRATGQCDPGIERIMSRTGLSRRSVFRALAELERFGLIVRARHGGVSHRNAYGVQWGALTGDAGCRDQGCQDRHLEGARCGTQTVPGLAPKPLKEPRKETWGGTVSPVAPSRSHSPPPGRDEAPSQQPPRQRHMMLPIPGGKREAAEPVERLQAGREERAMRPPRYRPKPGGGYRPSSAEVAREAACERWDAALRAHLKPGDYAQAVGRIEPVMERIATRAEMRERGAGLGVMLAALSLEAGSRGRETARDSRRRRRRAGRKRLLGRHRLRRGGDAEMRGDVETGTKGRCGMARAGRKRKDGARRHPNGTVPRRGEDRGVASYGRAKELIGVVTSPHLATPLGRKWYLGEVTTDERDAGLRWAEVTEEYRRLVLDAPKGSAKTAMLEVPVAGGGGASRSHANENERAVRRA